MNHTIHLRKLRTEAREAVEVAKKEAAAKSAASSLAPAATPEPGEAMPSPAEINRG